MTPLVPLERIANDLAPGVALWAKLEWLHPGGSDKDRVVEAMLAAAEAGGQLVPGATIIEPTSGNIGISLALAAAQRGYRLMLVMPDLVPPERVRLLRAMGVEVVLTGGAQGMQGAIAHAEALHHELPESWMPRQFQNSATALAHEATGHEIWQQTGGRVDAVIAGVATGGIITGVARALKTLRPTLRAIAVQPAASPVLTGGLPGHHSIYGLGPAFVPPLYDPTVIDEVISVSDAGAYGGLTLLMQRAGLPAGPGGGAALAAALAVARRPESEGTTLVVVIADSFERYLATDALALLEKES